MKVCIVEGCGTKLYCKGLCTKHYQRQRSHGTTDLVGKTVQQRFWEKVEKTDTCWNWTGSTTHNGYGEIGLNGGTVRSHRLAYEWANGPIPDGLIIDHTCHNRACVNPDHLRAVTHKQNQENRGGPQRNSSSGVRGVIWASREKRWKAQVSHRGWPHVAGYFKTIPEAEAAVVALRNKLFTHNDTDKEDKLDDPNHHGHPMELAA